ncbi:AMP-binding protein [Catenulispora yoronensis]
MLRGHSLTDLAALRDRYAKWYHANGVRPGDPVGVLVPEGFEPLVHFLALSALGAVPAMINDAMRPDVLVRYLDHVGVVGVVAFDTTRLAAAYREDPRSRPGSWPWPARCRRSTRPVPRCRSSTRTGTPPTMSWP